MNKIDILIVEDEKDHSAGIKKTLNQLGHNSYELDYECFHKNKINNIDIIILDTKNRNISYICDSIQSKINFSYILLVEEERFEEFAKHDKLQNFPHITAKVSYIEISAILTSIMQFKNLENEKNLSYNLFQLSMLVENSGKWTWDFETDEIFWDDRMHQIFGLSPDTFPGTIEAWKKLVSKEDREIFSAIMTYSKKNTKNLKVEYRVTTKDNKYKLLQTQGIIKNDKHNGNQLIGISFDITKNSLAEKELRESESRYKALIDSLPDIIYQFSTKNGLIYWSPSAKKMLGYTNEDLMNNPFIWYDIIHPDDKDKFNIIQEKIKKNIMFNIEYRVHDVKGNWLWLNNRATIIKEKEAGEIVIEGIATNITARKLAEKSLKESEERFRQLAESINNVFLILSPDWNKIIYVSPAYHKIWKKSCDSLYMQPNSWFDTIVEEDRPKIIEDINAKINDKYLNNRLPEFRIRWPDKSLRWIVFNVYPIRNKDNKIYRVAGIASDITERKILENNLYEAKNVADSANKAKSEFFANMSHELRTPLNAVIGYSQIMEMQKMDQLNKKQKEYLSYIKDNANHVLEMVNDILDLAKIEAGKFDIHKKPFDFAIMLQRSPSTIKSIANLKNIKLKIKMDPDIGWLDGDEVRIKQVIYNILSNAIKFTAENKSVGIDAYAEGDDIVVSIWDQGIGIPADDIVKIFAPFEQAKSEEQFMKKGTGLGLAISKKIVELHNGTIKVESQIGKGSRFTIIFPGRITEVLEIVPESRIETGIKSLDLKGNRIMVVEDNEVNRMLAGEFFNIYGINVDFAETGEHAISLAQKNEFDLIFMDIQLPGIGGVEAMQKIKEMYDNKIPIVALTAFAMKGDKTRYLNEGFDDYLSKPIIFDKLIEIINKFLDIEVKEIKKKITKPGRTKKVEKIITEHTPMIEEETNEEEMEIFNYQAVLERYLNNVELLKDVTGVFTKKLTGQIEKLEKAANDKDLKTIQMEAHSIKGSALNLQMKKIGDIAFEIEKIGKQESSKNLNECIKELKEYFEALKVILKEKEIM